MCGSLWERFCGWASGGWQCPCLRRSRRFCRSSINAVFAHSPTCQSITNCYSAELVFLLAGADIITMVMGDHRRGQAHCGAHSLALVGTSVRQQVRDLVFDLDSCFRLCCRTRWSRPVLCSIAMAMLKFGRRRRRGKTAVPRSSCSWRSSGARITAACSHRSAAL